MEAVPAPSGARRTVRLAAALVAGQVVLVAVVGWVTLTRPGDRPGPPSGAGIDQLAAPRAVIPPVPPSPSVTRSAAAPGGRERKHTAAPPVSETPSRPAAPKPPPPTTAAPSPAAPRTAAPRTAAPAVTSSAPLSLVPSPSASVSATPEPAIPGGPCDRIYALTRADDGRMMICLPDSNHQLRWKIV